MKIKIMDVIYFVEFDCELAWSGQLNVGNDKMLRGYEFTVP